MRAAAHARARAVPASSTKPRPRISFPSVKLRISDGPTFSKAPEPAPDAPRQMPTLEDVLSRPSSSIAPAPDKYAVIEVGGHQQFVEEGKWYTCNRLKNTEVGDVVKFERVLLVKDKESDFFGYGRPYMEEVDVQAEIIEELKGPKILIYKMKPKKHYRRTKGHRQSLTKFRITKIEINADPDP